MWRRIVGTALPGLAIGLVICIYASWITRHAAVVANPDAPMGAQFVLEVGSEPLSLLTGSALYRLKANTPSTVHLRTLDYGQVLLNWALVSAVIVSVGRSLFKRHQDPPPNSQPGLPRAP
jgi:hypothetical protein